MRRPCGPYSRSASTSTGCSWMHGTHHVAQKLSSTTWPRSAPRLTVSPSSEASVNSGASRPGSWDWIARGSRERPQRSSRISGTAESGISQRFQVKAVLRARGSAPLLAEQLAVVLGRALAVRRRAVLVRVLDHHAGRLEDAGRRVLALDDDADAVAEHLGRRTLRVHGDLRIAVGQPEAQVQLLRVPLY